MERIKFVIFLIFIIVFFIVLNGYVIAQPTKEQQLTKEQLEAFRSAKKVLIDVDQSYGEAERFLPDPPIKDRASKILNEFGLEPVRSESEEYDLKLKISVRGTPIKVYWKRLNRRIYTKASLEGSICFESQGIPAYEKAFRGAFESTSIRKIIIASDNVFHEEYFDRPSGAPFPFKAMWSKLWETLGEFYGIESIIREMQEKGTGVATHWAAEALGNLKNPDAVDPLIAALNARDKTLNEEAARALGKIGDPRAVEALIVLLKRNYNYLEGSRKDYNKIKYAVIEALGNIGDPRAIEPLIWYLPSAPPSGYYRVPNKEEELASRALIKITGLPKFSTRESAQIWWAMNRKNAAELFPEDMIPSLIKELRSSRTGADAEELLVSIGEPAVKPLVEVLSHKSLPIQYGASRILVEMGSIAVDSLLAILKDESSPHRGDAGLILGKIGDPRAVEPVLKALKDKDFPNRTDIVIALGRFRDPRAVEPVLKALKDKDFPKRDYVIVEIGKSRNKWVIKLLLDVLEDESSKFRGEAARVLGMSGDPRAVEPLIAAYKGRDWKILSSERNSIINALGQLKDPRAIAPLIDSMSNNRFPYPVVCSMLTKITGIDFGQSPKKWQKWWKKNKKKYLKKK